MSLVKELLILSICLCITQTVRGRDIGQDFMTQNIHIFGKNFEDQNFARHVRGLSEEIIDTEEDTNEASVEQLQDVDLDAMKQTANSRINELLDDETVGESLTSISKDFKEIFESPIAETTITEVADRIKTIMTSKESSDSIRAIQTRIKFFLLNKQAPKSVGDAINPFLSFITNPENVSRVAERGRFIVELVNVMAPGQNTFRNLQAMMSSGLNDKNTKTRIDRLFGSIHLLAEVDPNKTMKGIMSRLPGMTFTKLGSMFK